MNGLCGVQWGVFTLGGSNGNGTSGGTNRILSSIVNAGAALPLLKEIVDFSGLDTGKIAEVVRDYASGLNNAKADADAATDA